MAPLLFDKPALCRGVAPPMGVRRRLTARRSLTPPRLDSTPLRRTLLAWVFRNGWASAPRLVRTASRQYSEGSMIRPSETKELSLAEVHSSVGTSQVTFWRRMFAFAGPAYLVSVGYMGQERAASELQTQVAQLFEESREDVYRYLMTLGLTPSRAQDATQEVFLRLYAALKGGEE